MIPQSSLFFFLPILHFLRCNASAPITSFSTSYSQKIVLGRQSPSSILAASNSQDDTSIGTTSKTGRERGIYSRPSAAIERGSGFFIPGLEGPRIRLLFGMTVIIADAANHFLIETRPGDVGQIIAETTAGFYGIILLLQGIIESGGQGSRGIDKSYDIEGVATTAARITSAEQISDTLKTNEPVLKSIQKVANTIIDFTPTTYVLLSDNERGVLYSKGTGNDGDPTADTDEQTNLIKLALDAVSESRGGRVALPSEHPVSKLLPPTAARCILVQKVNGYAKGGACLIMGSDSLLQSFTKNDLRWIGQLAESMK